MRAISDTARVNKSWGNSSMNRAKKEDDRPIKRTIMQIVVNLEPPLTSNIRCYYE
jgi:hypothetical protein